MMNKKLEKLKEIWAFDNKVNSESTINEDLALFQVENNVLIPADLTAYFKFLNGKSDEYDDKLYHFYSFPHFKSIDEELKNWCGIPDYSNIVNTLDDYKSFYVFADYSFLMFSYAIKLHPNVSKNNEIVVICGDEYKVIAHFFSDFLTLYLNDSIELQF